MHFVAKICGIFSCAQDAMSTLGKDPSVGTSKRGGGSPTLEAFKLQVDKATATLTSRWGRSFCESETGLEPSRALVPPNLGGFWENHPKGMLSKELSCQEIQVLCTPAEDHVSYGCFSTVTLLPA